jgi:hypothetical protein
MNLNCILSISIPVHGLQFHLSISILFRQVQFHFMNVPFISVLSILFYQFQFHFMNFNFISSVPPEPAVQGCASHLPPRTVTRAHLRRDGKTAVGTFLPIPHFFGGGKAGGNTHRPRRRIPPALRQSNPSW